MAYLVPCNNLGKLLPSRELVNGANLDDAVAIAGVTIDVKSCEAGKGRVEEGGRFQTCKRATEPYTGVLGIRVIEGVASAMPIQKYST